MSSRGEMPLVLGKVVFCSDRRCVVGRCGSRLGFCTISSPLFLAEEASWVAQTVKNPPAMQETQDRFLGQEDPLEEGGATHSGILARRIPWTEKPGGLQSTGLQRVRHN